MSHDLTFMTNGGSHYEISGIKYVGTINEKIGFGVKQNDIIHDVDGTVSGKNAESYITPSKPHLKDNSHCEIMTDLFSVPVVVCNN